MQSLFDGAAQLGFDVQLCDHAALRHGAWRVVYGLGGADRVGYADYQGLIAFDLAYWDRKGDDRKFRVSVNGFHCPQQIMRGADPGPARWRQSNLTVEQCANPDGPILLVGNGPKSNAVGAHGWSARKSRELRGLGRPVWYRPKPGRHQEPDVLFDAIADGGIEEVLQQVSMVVCRHSNVAIDACRLGVPVVCEDGAAAAIYPHTLDGPQPDAATRLEFLHRLAWWQWSPAECATGKFWEWIKGRI